MRLLRSLAAWFVVLFLATSGPMSALAQSKEPAKGPVEQSGRRGDNGQNRQDGPQDADARDKGGETTGGRSRSGLRPNAVRDPDVIAQDPMVRTGVLPNGLRYSVMRNATPPGAVSLRLMVDVGSFEEGDDERGVAHFLEHMAFNGTRNFPENELDRILAPAGVQFGRDQNASTGYFNTTYMLDLPSTDATKLDLGFKWLRDVADGVLLEEDAVVRERGVVMAEHDSGVSPQRTVATAIIDFMGKGLRTPTRDPIGTPASIRSMSAARLRAFYDRWYRPDNAVVVVVGDLPVEELERRVTETFSSWRPRGPAPVRAPRGTPAQGRPMQVLVREEPSLATFLMACKVGPTEGPKPATIARLRGELEHELWQAVLNERFTALASGENPPFLAGFSSWDDSNRESAQTCLMAVPLQDDWNGALQALSDELRRFIAHGPTDEELDRAIEAKRSLLRGAAGGQNTRPTPELSNLILARAADDGVNPSPDEAARIYERAVAGITEETLRERAAADWAGPGPLVVLAAPEGPEPSAILTAWTEAQRRPTPPAMEAVKPSTWAYTDFGAPGRVVKRETINPPGFTRLTFSNGVVVNFKQSDLEQDRVSVRVRFGAGRGGVAPADLFIASIGSQLLVEGGLGKHDADTLRRMFSDRGWGADLSMLDNGFIIEGLTATNGLETQLQIMAAYLTDPGFRPGLDARLPTYVDTVYRMRRTDPDLVLAEAMSDALTPGSPMSLPPREALARMKSADFARLFRPALLNAPLEVTVVGDVSEAEMTGLMARTLGALPRRTGKFERRTDSWWARFPEQAPPVIRAHHEGPQEKAVVAAIWPLYVADPARRREEFSLNLVASVLDYQLRHRIREELGKSYAPSASISMPDFSDQGAITVMVETSPADAEAVAREIQEAGAELARGGVDQTVLDTVRTPFLEQRRQLKSRNDWWMDALDGSAADGTNLNDFLTIEDIFSSLTLADVKKAAATWLSRAPAVAIVTPTPRGTQTAATSH